MSDADKNFQKNAMTAFIQIAAVVLLIFWCLTIVAPFMSIVVWAMLIAVAVYPLHLSITSKIGGRPKTSATLIVLLGLAILLIPTFFLAESSITAIKSLTEGAESGTLSVPPPNDSVADWPLIGSQVHALWSETATNLEATLNKYNPQLQSFAQGLAKFAGSSAIGILQFIISIIVAGVFLVSAEGGYRVARTMATQLSADYGVELTDMSIATIRSVAKGVLGVAIIQATLSAIGMVLMDIPAAGLWTFLILVLAIVQLPPLIVLGPMVIWVFSVSSGTPATIFAVYALIVSGSDSFLKPLFLGRGMEIPMLVILLGAIGGMMTQGIIGLFIGAVILAVGYKILTAWMQHEDAQHAADTPAPDAVEAG
jgi:predicted PurR-regulated permease PerM